MRLGVVQTLFQIDHRRSQSSALSRRHFTRSLVYSGESTSMKTDFVLQSLAINHEIHSTRLARFEHQHWGVGICLRDNFTRSKSLLVGRCLCGCLGGCLRGSTSRFRSLIDSRRHLSKTFYNNRPVGRFRLLGIMHTLRPRGGGGTSASRAGWWTPLSRGAGLCARFTFCWDRPLFLFQCLGGYNIHMFELDDTSVSSHWCKITSGVVGITYDYCQTYLLKLVHMQADFLIIL